MIVGSIKEDIKFEKRVSVTPESAKNIISLGLDVQIEKGYAEHIGIPDKLYLDNGVQIKNSPKDIIENSDLLLKVGCPSNDEIDLIKKNLILVGIFNPSNNETKLKELLKKETKIFSLELLPRITRAQSMDVFPHNRLRIQSGDRQYS